MLYGALMRFYTDPIAPVMQPRVQPRVRCPADMLDIRPRGKEIVENKERNGGRARGVKDDPGASHGRPAGTGVRLGWAESMAGSCAPVLALTITTTMPAADASTERCRPMLVTAFGKCSSSSAQKRSRASATNPSGRLGARYIKKSRTPCRLPRVMRSSYSARRCPLSSSGTRQKQSFGPLPK